MQADRSPMLSEMDTEWELCRLSFSLQGADVLEIGCGRGDFARRLAAEGQAALVTAIDSNYELIEKNRAGNERLNLFFSQARAEGLEFPEGRFDVVFMLKSLHHVPKEKMLDALKDAMKTTRNRGYLYISEPYCEGNFNDIIEIFHDERIARARALEAIHELLRDSQFKLIRNDDFASTLRFRDFEQFDTAIVRGITGGKELPDAIVARVKSSFLAVMTDSGAEFRRKSRFFIIQKRAKEFEAKDRENGRSLSA